MGGAFAPPLPAFTGFAFGAAGALAGCLGFGGAGLAPVFALAPALFFAGSGSGSITTTPRGEVLVGRVGWTGRVGGGVVEEAGVAFFLPRPLPFGGVTGSGGVVAGVESGEATASVLPLPPTGRGSPHRDPPPCKPNSIRGRWSWPCGRMSTPEGVAGRKPGDACDDDEAAESTGSTGGRRGLRRRLPPPPPCDSAPPRDAPPVSTGRSSGGAALSPAPTRPGPCTPACCGRGASTSISSAQRGGVLTDS